MKIIKNNTVFRDVCVLTINMGDVEDPAFHSEHLIAKWLETDAGKFIVNHALESPCVLSQHDLSAFGYTYKVMAKLSTANETFWKLKWG